MRHGIQIDGTRIRRPLGSGYRSVHRLLKHLQVVGFKNCPEVLAVEEPYEWLTLLAGDTYDDVQAGAIATQNALISAAEQLRQLHDCSVSFLQQHTDSFDQWMLPAQQPAEVICHGDYAPYNVVLSGSQVVGVFDFDTAHPGPRLWDLAYAVYCWAPLKSLATCSEETKTKSLIRARQFLDAYGVTVDQRASLVSMMLLRLQALVGFMRVQADRGNKKFSADIQDGHLDQYLADIDYLQRHEVSIMQKLK
ncbi:hypothetical protein BGP77_04260 [Saccharospirillum sp. MSK14-1]|uniref:aminoglycoside phosphotransferase family protein n=1 Tax=Saccharospirillum sp. MSK14-1 TaxID=1897632 RepID=UPI000D37DE02|nr:aminoglycoside phosphotransferase family protein [Saccharospirillum sp. MSK14-1]PTY36517.1 hypothetical protein BGP77_04260 [Saccharospirillum sp. MSK14-1]